MAKKRSRLSEVFSVTLPAPSKTWEYRGRVIEEDFETRDGRMGKTRTGYVIQHRRWRSNGLYIPGKYRTLAEVKRGVDEVLKEGVW